MGDRAHIAFRQFTQALHHRGHRARRGTVPGGKAGAQVLEQVVLGPRHWRLRECRQGRRFPTLRFAASQIGLATPLAAQGVARRVARAAVAQSIGQIRAAIPLCGARGVRYVLLVAVEQHVPSSQQRPGVERERQLRFGWARYHRVGGHQVGIERLHVGIADLGKRRVREGRIEPAAIAMDAFAHGALERRVGPVADAGLGVGRDVGGIDGAERRFERQPTGIARAAWRRMAHRAVAGGGYQPAALDGRRRIQAGPGRRHRGDGRAPRQDRGTQAGQRRQRGQGGQQPGALARRLVRAGLVLERLADLPGAERWLQQAHAGGVVNGIGHGGGGRQGSGGTTRQRADDVDTGLRGKVVAGPVSRQGRRGLGGRAIAPVVVALAAGGQLPRGGGDVVGQRGGRRLGA
ncbi:hypothetical protein D3C87_1112750 [compost metagenome]